MSSDYCPLCYTRLEVREVAPCIVCGHQPEELDHARTGRHTFAEMRIFGSLTLVLCDFCQVDFGSFEPEFFGLPRSHRFDFRTLERVRAIEEIYIGKDRYCPQCGYRLAFLEFVDRVRKLSGH